MSDKQMKTSDESKTDVHVKGGEALETIKTDLVIWKKRFIFTPLLLGFVTFGIYHLVWLYKITDEMMNHTKDTSISPGKTIGFLFIPIFNLFWAIYLLFHIPGLIKDMEMKNGVPMKQQTNAGLIGIAGLIPIINIFWSAMVQNALNRYWDFCLNKN